MESSGPSDDMEWRVGARDCLVSVLYGPSPSGESFAPRPFLQLALPSARTAQVVFSTRSIASSAAWQGAPTSRPTPTGTE